MHRMRITQECAENKILEKCDEKNYSLIERFIYKNNKTKIHLKCNVDGYEWYVTYYNLINGNRGCPKCGKVAPPTQQDAEFFVNERCLKKNFSLVENFKYVNASTKIHLKCNVDGYEWFSTYNNINKTGCRKCSKTAKLTYKKFKKNIIDRCKEINCKAIFPIIYNGSKTKIHLKCNIDGYEWFPEYNNFINSANGCPKCKKVRKLSVSEMKKNIITRCDEMNYSLVSDIINVGSKAKIKIKCNICGTEWEPNYNNFFYKKTGCPKCKQSKGELTIVNYLKLNKIKFAREYKFNDCKFKRNLSFDFYLPEHNLCIEFDGEQHFHPQNCWGSENEFKLIKIRDKIKNNYCLDNNIELIRIKYNENIEKILNSRLLLKKIC